MTAENSARATRPSRSIEVLAAAQRRKSQTKRARVQKTVDDMLLSGEAITFAAVARKARVSTWLVYAEGVRGHIEQAIAHQAEKPPGKESPDAPSSVSLRTDLALTRAEIKLLRTERDTLRRNMQRLLGRQLDQPHTAELIERIDSLLAENRTLASQLHQVLQEGAGLRERVAELEEDLGAARTSLRRMIRDHSQMPSRHTQVDEQERDGQHQRHR